MPRALSAAAERERLRGAQSWIPLLEVTMWADRFDPVTARSHTVRVSNEDRPSVLGLEWLGTGHQWGGLETGIGRVTQLDLAVDNSLVWAHGKRLSDCLRVGVNQGPETYDPTLWDGLLYALPEGGGPGDELLRARLLLEEVQGIDEKNATLRFSGPELFLDFQDGAARPPGSLVTVQHVGSGGVGVGVLTMGWDATVAGGFRELIVAVAVDNPAGAATASVTAGGLGMTLLAVETNGANIRVEWWGLLAPPVGVLPIEVSFTEGVPSSHKAGVSLALSNVSQATPFRPVAAAQGNTAAPTSTAIALAGDLVADVAAYYFEAGSLPDLAMAAAPAGRTQRANRTDQGNPGSSAHFLRMGVSTAYGQALVPMAWSIVGGFARNWSAIALPIVPAA
jgi:hypothetical protein